MKSLTKLSFAVVPLIGALSSANAALTLGDSVNVNFLGTVSSKYESNVLLVRNSGGDTKGDTSVTIAPGILLSYNNPQVSDFSGSLNYNYRITSFRNYNDLNTQDNNLSGQVVYALSGMNVRGTLSYVEAHTNVDLDPLSASEVLAGRVDRNVLSVGAVADMQFSPKTSVDFGALYLLQAYDTLGYTDNTSLSIPINFYHALTAKTDATLDLTYRTVWLGSQNSANATDMSVMMGLRGEISPKITGYLRGGFTSRDNRSLADGTDKTMLTFSGSLNYEVSPLLSLAATLNRDFGVSSYTRGSTERTGGGLSATYHFIDSFSAGASLNYWNTKYQGYDRTDDYIVTSVFASYAPNENLNFRVAYNYNVNNSDSLFADYDNNVLEVSASIRF